jgi:glycosyltransferase involved in cell wall biosynthesis
MTDRGQRPSTIDHGPLVSIILPVCDGQAYIGATLDSALRQTYSHIEVIVVDDGSRDRTREIVEAHAARDSRIRVIRQANCGVAAARNRALAAARGEFIAPIDADDIWDPTKLERQVRRMVGCGDGTGLVYCWWMWIDIDGRVLDCSPRWQVEGRVAQALMLVNFTGNASVPLYRRRCLEEIGGYDVALRERGAQGCEDWDVALKVAERSHVAVVPSMLVGYRRHRQSMSAQSERMRRSHALIMSAAQRRHPALSSGLIRQSRDQFALHLAGVSYWTGAYGQAIGLGLQAARSTVMLEILPYVARLFAKRIFPRNDRMRGMILPGVSFSDVAAPQALIPYDRIYARRFKRLRPE